MRLVIIIFIVGACVGWALSTLMRYKLTKRETPEPEEPVKHPTPKWPEFNDD